MEICYLTRMASSPSHDAKKTTAYGKIDNPALIQRNNFKFKSLSDWSYNISVGCKHGCTFCYVPSTSLIKQETNLEKTPDLIPREWIDERKKGKHWGDHPADASP